VATKPPIDLLNLKLIPPYRIAWHGSNKAVRFKRLSRKQRCPGSVKDVFQVYCDNGFRFASHLGVLRFRNSDWLHISIRGTSVLFLTF